jgi:hypothetical protein
MVVRDVVHLIDDEDRDLFDDRVVVLSHDERERETVEGVVVRSVGRHLGVDFVCFQGFVRALFLVLKEVRNLVNEHHTHRLRLQIHVSIISRHPGYVMIPHLLPIPCRY